MKRNFRNIARRLTLGLALALGLTACQSDDLNPDAPQDGQLFIESIEIGAIETVAADPQTDPDNTRAATPDPQAQTRAADPAPDARGYLGVVKKQFVDGDVLHLRFTYDLTDGNSDPKVFTATATLSSGRWTLTPAVAMPRSAKTILINAFYDGLTTPYTTVGDHDAAFIKARTYAPGTTAYPDMLSAGYNLYQQDGTPAESPGGMRYNPATGALSLKLTHQNALISVPGITLTPGLPAVTGLQARLSTNTPDETLRTNFDIALTPLPTNSTAYEALAPQFGYLAARGAYPPVLTHFIATTATAQQMEVPVPDDGMPLGGSKNVEGRLLDMAPIDLGHLGSNVATAQRFAYQLIFTPGRMQAIPTNDLPQWGNGSEAHPANVPQGYIPIRTASDLAKVGRGSILEGDPNTLTEAQKIGSDGKRYDWRLTDRYIQLADIDLTPGRPDGSATTGEASVNPGGNNPASWHSIGRETNGGGIYNSFFSGIYNGGGHTITGLTIDETTSGFTSGYDLGLFGRVSGATLYNIHLRGVSITATGSNQVGALAGSADNSTLALCSVQGTEAAPATVSGKNTVGGLVSYVDNTHLTRCYTRYVSAGGTQQNVGGLVGYATGKSLLASCFTHRATATSASYSGYTDISGTAGGLVGSNDGSTLYACYATRARVSTNQDNSYAGALVGYNAANADYQSAATLLSCYATLDASAWQAPADAPHKATRLAPFHSSDNSYAAIARFCLAPNGSHYDHQYAVTSGNSTNPGGATIVGKGEGDTPVSPIPYPLLLTQTDDNGATHPVPALGRNPEPGPEPKPTLEPIRTLVVSDGTTTGVEFDGNNWVPQSTPTPQGGITIVERTWQATFAWQTPLTPGVAPQLSWTYEGE